MTPSPARRRASTSCAARVRCGRERRRAAERDRRRARRARALGDGPDDRRPGRVHDPRRRRDRGWVGWYKEDEPDYRHGGLDIFVAPAHQGRGIGREALSLAARWLISERGHHRIIIDPAAGNTRAIATYAALGFRPVGVMRRYERGPDGTWHDGLLMDLLAEEFTPS